MTQQDNTAPELKSAETTEAFGDFMHAFGAFREANDERLAQIERKLSADVVTVDKVERINRALDEQKRAVDQLVLRDRRPALGRGGVVASAATTEHKAAFEAYVRRGGEDGLRAFEQKAATWCRTRRSARSAAACWSPRRSAPSAACGRFPATSTRSRSPSPARRPGGAARRTRAPRPPRRRWPS
jgi:hypothetical protein